MLDLINSIHIFALANAKKDLLAQLVEQRPFKAWALGSSPRGITKSLHLWGLFLVNTQPLPNQLVFECTSSFHVYIHNTLKSRKFRKLKR